MKKIYFLSLTLLSILYTNAQVASTYVFSQSSSAYTPITGGTVYGDVSSDDEQFVDPATPLGGTTTTGVGIPIGFNFTYNGQVFDRIAINYNGWISLGNSAVTPSVNIESSENFIPLSGTSSAVPAYLRSRIAGLAMDLQPNATSELRVQTIGTAPNQVCVIQWKNVQEYEVFDDTINFQIRLAQTANSIQTVYGTNARPSSGSLDPQVGIGGSTETDYSIRTGGSWTATTTGITNSDLILFTSTSVPPTGLTYTWTLASCLPPSTLNFTNTVTPNASISWSAVAGAASYEYAITTSATPPASGTNTTVTNATVNGLPAGSPIYGHVRTNCGSGSFSVWKTISYIPPPSNDSCGAPVALSPGTAVSGSTIGATQSLPATACTGFTSSSAYDVWYSATALSNGNFTVSVNGTSGFDAVVGIYRGACGSLTLDTCRDFTSTNGTEAITIANAVAGTKYLIRVYRYNNTTDSVGTFTINATGPALPVSGVVLSGIRNGNKAQLSWQTLTEINNAGFELQRSADGRSFTGISSIASKANGGNSTAVINYNAEDIKPFTGANYYRLKQTDKDGKINFSNIVYLKGAAVSTLTLSAVYPNPTRDLLKAAIQSPTAENITLIITDMMGKTIGRQVSPVTKGDNTVNVNVASLPSGSYLLKATCSNGCESAYQKFTKQ